MNVPKPRPPGPWRAIARDARLNPEEEAARAAVADLADTTPRHEVAEEPVLTPRQRLIPFQSLVDRAGWRLRFTESGVRARAEAFHHPTRAALMVTSRTDRKPIHAYVLEPRTRGLPTWMRTAPHHVEYFLAGRLLPPGAKRRPYKNRCTCPKGGYPTELWAKTVRTNLQIKNIYRRGLPATEGSVYRCPDDPRVWHITRRGPGNRRGVSRRGRSRR
ncbi:hypothetical protein AB0O01_34760 [Streptomyces sp. NPDC093252]|uniref:hypothetical protein n=1 Tax=Streptomyces sp. NPDC093252 TaxID=3154980 RepID=UPI0034368BB3